ncbi:Unknown protein [Striga hermonthica]|uniref:Transmembrane protein n=1 Tax=Striga hermonthica TaxID=68872 RepID=A0A9N7NKW6_STRHE|nr:Unknown protein [Striga hermonthica]
MSTMKSECDGNFSESLFGSYSFVHDHKSCKGNSSSLDYLIPDAKWWLNHRHGLKTGLESQLVDEYFACTKNDSSISSDVFSEVILSSSDSCDYGLTEQPVKSCSESDTHWVGLDKIRPWWHAVDKDDIASSHDNGSLSVEKVLDGCEICFGQSEERMEDEEKAKAYESDGRRGLTECMLPESCKTFGSQEDSPHASEPDSPSTGLTRAQLLQALCHSQTRAREAEKSAQEACDEKEKIVNIFFQQASCLFAYRQWLRLLQLESLCLHLGRRPADPIKGTVSLMKKGTRAPRTKRAKAGCCVSKRAIAFTVGFALAGAGLLVGWTVGWLLPAL